MRTKIGLGIDVCYGAKLKKWTPNYNLTGRLKIPKFNIKIGDTLEFKIILSEDTVQPVIFDCAAPRVYLQLSRRNGEFVAITTRNFNYAVNGKTDGKFHLGVELHIQIVFRVECNVEFFGSNFMFQGLHAGLIYDIALKSANKSRYYSSIINSRNQPTTTTLIDDLCKYRKNEYVAVFTDAGQFAEIEPWKPAKGDEIEVRFIWSGGVPKWQYIFDSDSSNGVFEFGISRFGEITLEGPVTIRQANGDAITRPVPGVEYHYIITVTHQASSIITLGNYRTRLDAFFCGYIISIKLSSKNGSDSRNYEFLKTSDTQPEDDYIKETIGGKHANLKGFKVIQVTSHYSSVQYAKKNKWTNELSTDGALVDFGNSAWTEL